MSRVIPDRLWSAVELFAGCPKARLVITAVAVERRSPSEVAPGDRLVTRLAEGEVRSTVDGDG